MISHMCDIVNHLNNPTSLFYEYITVHKEILNLNFIRYTYEVIVNAGDR